MLWSANAGIGDNQGDGLAVIDPSRRPSRGRKGREDSTAAIAFTIETMKGPAESGQICSAGRRKIAKKIAKNKRCYANTLRPRSRMLLKVMKGGRGVITPWVILGGGGGINPR